MINFMPKKICMDADFTRLNFCEHRSHIKKLQELHVVWIVTASDAHKI